MRMDKLRAVQAGSKMRDTVDAMNTINTLAEASSDFLNQKPTTLSTHVLVQE
jgi:hypothetical protein